MDIFSGRVEGWTTFGVESYLGQEEYPAADGARSVPWKLLLVQFHSPRPGCLVYHVCDKANTEQMNLHLQQISARLPKGHHALIVLDKASWHKSKTLQVPENVWLLHLPPYSPQLNSAENLFQYFKKTFIANRVFETTDILKEAVLDGLNKLAKNTDRIKSIGKRTWVTLTNQNKAGEENKTCSDG